MKPMTWMILGASSIIAEEFAHLAAQAGNPLILVARNAEQLATIAADIRLRYHIPCNFICADFSTDFTEIVHLLQNYSKDIALFIAHSVIRENSGLDQKSIDELIKVNIQSTVQLIHTYLHKQQTLHRIIFLSSVAACRGRAKNSLYGGSKAAIEIYLEGLQQSTETNRHITIVRLGFIDTAQTYGSPGIFYASSPKRCAKACWQASQTQKRLIYHPFFWRYIMKIISQLPYFIYKKMSI